MRARTWPHPLNNNNYNHNNHVEKKRDCVGVPQGGLQSRSAYHREHGLRVGSWNFSGLCRTKGGK